MAETTDAPQTTDTDDNQLTDEQVDQAIADSLNTDDGSPPPDTPADDGKPDDDKPSGKPSDWDSQLQRQDQKIGNMGRKLDEIAEALKPKPEDKPPDKQQQKVLADLKDLKDDDIVEGRQLRDLVSQFNEVLTNQKPDEAKAEEMKQLQAEVATLRADAIFDAAFPGLKGQRGPLSQRAWKEVIKDMGEDTPESELQGAANFALARIAKNLSAQQQAAGKTKKVDNTAKMKPAEPAKGADTVKKGAAPTDDNVDDWTDEQLDEYMAKMLEEEPSE